MTSKKALYNRDRKEVERLYRSRGVKKHPSKPEENTSGSSGKDAAELEMSQDPLQVTKPVKTPINFDNVSEMNKKLEQLGKKPPPLASTLTVEPSLPPPSVPECNNLNEITDKLQELERKIDVINYNCVGIKRMMENIEQSVNKIVKTMVPKNTAANKVEFPLEDEEDLEHLEEKSKDQDFEDALFEKFASFSSKSPYEMFRVAVSHLFHNTCRFTWSGRIAHNAQHASTTRAASDLHVVKILIDSAISKFQTDRDTAVSEFIKALNNFNEARAARQKRRKELKSASLSN